MSLGKFAIINSLATEKKSNWKMAIKLRKGYMMVIPAQVLAPASHKFVTL